MAVSEIPTPARLFFKVPVIGWVARDLWRDFDGNIWYFLVALISLWAISVATWGLSALYLPAMAAVPAMFVVLILISRG